MGEIRQLREREQQQLQSAAPCKTEATTQAPVILASHPIPAMPEIGVAVVMAFIATLVMRARFPKPDEGFGNVFFAWIVFFAIGFAGRFLFGFSF